MKIELYIGLLVVLMVGLFVVSPSWAESVSPTCVQCCAPVNTWCTPATAGSSVVTTPPAQPVAPATPVQRVAPVPVKCQVVAPSETPWEVLGSILQVPFVIGQCIFGTCPPPPC